MAKESILNFEQNVAFRAIEKFIVHPSADIFVLKGYAGTGKTYLMQYLAKFLSNNEQEFCMLASTGRAATVLKGKTGFATKTVHSELYNFNKIDGLDDTLLSNKQINKGGQMSMEFLVREADQNKRIYIVDESSMLSGDLSKDVMFAKFGSGILLNDFFDVVGKNKIIFVGDPCQLPPVNQNFSPALDIRWLAEHNKIAISITLKKIERVDSLNDILKLAGLVREMSEQSYFPHYIKLPASNLNDVKIHPSDKDLFQEYFTKYKATGVNSTLAIARSNKLVQYLNKEMRQGLYGLPDLPLQIGDVLLVTQNNYKVPLTNGDFVTICELNDFRSKASLKFQTVRVKSISSEIEYNILLSLDALNSGKGNITTEQMKDLMIDFSYRMQDRKIQANSLEYKKAMLEDDYLNCLKTTYGYAVTCHKSQGGEWDNVFLFLEKSMYSMAPSELCKWWYTAITRAKRELHLSNNWWIS